jgi:hypothetical protein
MPQANSASAPSPGWAVAIGSAADDQQWLRLQLAPPGEPWVEADSRALRPVLLRSERWTNIAEAAGVHADAQRMVKWLNEAYPLTSTGAQRFEVGVVYQFDERDGRSVNVFPADLVVSSSTSAVANTSGQMVSQFAGDLRKSLNAAITDASRAHVLESLEQLDYWGDIYKAAEAIRLLAGDQDALKQALVASGHWQEWDRCWQTANYHRHAVGCPASLPKVPATPPSARDIVRVVASMCLQKSRIVSV